MKRIMPFIMSLVLLAGCASTSTESKSTDSSASQTDESSEASIFNEYGNANFAVESVDEDESYFENKTKLVWLTNYSYEVDSAAIQNEVNKLLDERDYDFAVQFINFNETEGKGDDVYLMQDAYKDRIAADEQVDIFNSGMGIDGAEGFEDVSHTYQACVDNGWFLSLNDYFETELGQKLYEQYPEWYWQALTCSDGNIYGRGLYSLGTTPLALTFNEDCLNEYGVDVTDWDGTIEGLSKYLKQAYEKSGMPPLQLADYAENYNEYVGFISYNGIYYNTETGEFENIFENEKAIDYLKTVEKYKNEGYITTGDNSVTDETAICSVTAMLGVYKSSSNATVLCDTYFDTDDINMVTGISTTSENPDKAFELLALVSTDEELATLIYDGIEGRNYVLNSDNEKVQNLQAPAFSSWLHTPANPMIADPTADDNQNMKEDCEKQLQSTKANPLKNFEAENTEDIEKLAEIYSSFYSLFYGDYIEYESLDTALAQANKQLDEAGIDEILDELNSQLEEREQANGTDS